MSNYINGVLRDGILSKATVPVNSKGNSFATIQAAIDDLAGGGWVYAPAGTYSETVTIDENNVLLFGAGMGSTIIDGGAGHGITINTANDVCVRDLQVKTTAGGGNISDSLQILYLCNRITVENIFVSQSDRFGVICYNNVIGTAYDIKILNCILQNCDDDTINSNGFAADKIIERLIVSECQIYDSGLYGISFIGHTLYSNCINNIIRKTGDDGIFIGADSDYCVVDGNNIKEYTNEGIDDDSGTATVGDNEINA